MVNNGLNYPVLDQQRDRLTELAAENAKLKAEFEEYKHREAACRLDSEWGLIHERDKLEEAIRIAREALEQVVLFRYESDIPTPESSIAGRALAAIDAALSAQGGSDG